MTSSMVLTRSVHAFKRFPAFLCSKHKVKVISSATKVGFWEYDEKSGYNTDKKSDWEKIKLGKSHFKDELKLFTKEVKEGVKDYYYKPVYAPPFIHGDYEYCWKFDGEESLKDWIVTTDKDNLEGFSDAFFSVSKTNKALFSGFLCTEVPNNGVTQQAGYCCLRSPIKKKSFQRRQTMDWGVFTHLIMKIRGDGRTYQLNLKVRRKKDFDIIWNRLHSYPLYTHGGPYWQFVKIPFSKFFTNFKGRMQDKQNAINTGEIEHLQILVADQIDGPFQIEIDYIGLLLDETHTEKIAYEMYKTDRGAAAIDN